MKTFTSSSMLAAGVAYLASLSLANAAAAVPKCESGTRTYNAGYDILKAGTAPPAAGFMNLTYTGFTVNNRNSYGNGADAHVIPHSRPNYLTQSDGAFFSSVTVLNNEGGSLYDLNLESFYFACSMYQYALQTYTPEPCDLTIIATDPRSHFGNIQNFTASYGGVDFQTNGGYDTNMTMVRLPENFAGYTMYFALSGGTSENVLAIDNLVYSTPCSDY